MTDPIFTAEDLSRAFDRAIIDVKANSTTELASLSVLLQVLGDFLDEGTYIMAGLILGQVGGATFQLRNLQTLDPTVEQVLRSVARELGGGLDALKGELCDKPAVDPAAFNEVMGNLAKVQWRLIQRLNVVQQTPFATPFGGPGEE
ncbi:MAG: hypothetical protein ACE5LS_02515 [Thermoplasmata archaeon]